MSKPVEIGPDAQDRNSSGYRWRIVTIDGDLKFQRLEGRSWVTKDTISG